MRNAPFYFLALMLAMVLAWTPSVPSGAQSGTSDQQSASASRSMETGTSDHGVRYATGGIGKTERDRMQAMNAEYPLKLVFATDKGKYLSDVRVRVVNGDDTVILDQRSAGPWFYLDVPPGHYKVITELGGRKESRAVSVSDGQSLKTIQYRW